MCAQALGRIEVAGVPSAVDGFRGFVEAGERGTSCAFVQSGSGFLGSRPQVANLLLIAGGALSRNTGSKSDLVKVPPPSMGADMAQLLNSGTGVDYTFVVEDEDMKVGQRTVGGGRGRGVGEGEGGRPSGVGPEGGGPWERGFRVASICGRSGKAMKAGNT